MQYPPHHLYNKEADSRKALKDREQLNLDLEIAAPIEIAEPGQLHPTMPKNMRPLNLKSRPPQHLKSRPKSQINPHRRRIRTPRS